MLDRSTKLDASLMDAYNSIHELHKGHAAGDSDLDKQASQLASDIRYKAKSKFKEGTNPEDKKRVYLSLLSSSSAPTVVKQKAKKKLLGESVTEDAAYEKVLKDLKGQFGSNAVLGTGETPKDTRSEKSKKKATRKRAASDEKERRFKKRNPAVTSGRYPKDDEKAWVAAREREKREGIGEATAVNKIINAIREDSKYGYDAKGRSKNPADIKKRKKVSEGKLIHGPFGPYITGQKMPKEQKEIPLKQVPYEGLNGSRKSVGEAKVDQGLDDEAKEDARNYRRFGTKHNQHGTAVLRRSLERSKRGEKKVKGAKSVEEEVGISSAAAMEKARKEAELRRKEEQAVKKEKKALKKEEMNIDETRLKGSQKAVTLKPRYGDHLGDMYSKDPDEGDLETMLKDSSKKRRADTIRPLKQKVKATAKKMKKEETAPSVAKVIESIKINKCTPKSPNVVIMPKKDDITDKAGGKTTKEVVSKKHKQFFNKEDKVKTFRQFVTETEQVDENLLGNIAKVGSAVKKSQAVATVAKGAKAVSDTVSKVPRAVSGAAELAQGGAQMASQVAQKSISQVGKVVQGAGRLGSDVVKHGGSAAKAGAEEIKRTKSIGTGVEKFGTELSKKRIIARGRAPKGITGAVDTDKLNKMAKSKWRGTKRKIGKVAKSAKTGAELYAVGQVIKRDQETRHDVESGSRTGELRNPT